MEYLRGHAQEPGGFPDGHATLHQPVRRRVAQCMGRYLTRPDGQAPPRLNPFFTEATGFALEYGVVLRLGAHRICGRKVSSYREGLFASETGRLADKEITQTESVG
jgi:hypothetical protein